MLPIVGVGSQPGGVCLRRHKHIAAARVAGLNVVLCRHVSQWHAHTRCTRDGSHTTACNGWMGGDECFGQVKNRDNLTVIGWRPGVAI